MEKRKRAPFVNGSSGKSVDSVTGGRREDKPLQQLAALRKSSGETLVLIHAESQPALDTFLSALFAAGYSLVGESPQTTLNRLLTQPRAGKAGTATSKGCSVKPRASKSFATTTTMRRQLANERSDKNTGGSKRNETIARPVTCVPCGPRKD